MRKCGQKQKSLRANRRAGGFALVLVILLVVGLVMLLPAVAGGDSIMDVIHRFFGGLFGDETIGYVGVGFTVYFADGSSWNYGASPTFQIAPMSIMLEDKEVDSFDIVVRAKVLEDAGLWQASVVQQIEMYKKGTVSPSYSSTGHFSDSGISWTAGEVKSLAVTTLDWQTIENVVAGEGAATWHFQVNVIVDMEIDVDGSTREFSGLAPSGSLELVYVSGESNPSISVSTMSKPVGKKQ